MKDLPPIPENLLKTAPELPTSDLLLERFEHTMAQLQRMDEVYHLVLSHYGISPGNKPLLTHCVWYGLVGLLEKYLKYATSDLLARVLDQTELPVCPVWADLGRAGPFVGGLGNHLRRVLLFHRRSCNRRSDLSVGLAYSIYQAKSGSLPVTEEFVSAQVDGALDKLTSERPDICPDVEADYIYQAIDSTVDEVFDYAGAPRSVRPVHHLVPSLRSSFQSTRAEGGGAGWVLDSLRRNAWQGTSGPEPLDVPTSEGGLVADSLRKERLHGETSKAGNSASPILRIYPNFGILYGYCSYRFAVAEFRGPDPDDFDFEIEESRIRALRLERVNCVPVGLLEPFKVRVITRGDADSYHLGRRWQRSIHPLMAKHPCLALIKSPIQQWHLDDFSSKLGTGILAGPRFLVSGDYEAATDNLDPDYSRYCLSAMCRRLGVPLEDSLALTRALTEHRMYRDKRDKCPRDQVWGQLMGSPVSFLILCLLNLSVTRLAMDMGGYWEHWDGHGAAKRRLADYPILINGDDVGFESNDSSYGIWKYLTSKVGLKFSLGKNFTHPDWLILNSQLHRRVPQVDFFGQVSDRLWPTPFLEAGLLYGCVKGQTRDLSEDSMFIASTLERSRSLPSMATDLIAPWNPEQRDRLMTRFLSFWSDTLKGIPGGMSWFLPRQLGGLGLPRTRPVEVTTKQLKLAAFLSTRPVTDPLVGSLVSPDIPGYLATYMREEHRVREKLGTPKVQVTLSQYAEHIDGSMKAASTFCMLGAESLRDLKDMSEQVRQKWITLWRMGQQTSLSPMGVEKALGWKRFVIFERFSWLTKVF